MEQYQDVFARYEEKYLLDEAAYRGLMAELMAYMEPDHYERAMVSNIYYDTPDCRLIRASLEKPAYKEKLRLRSYGTPGDESEVFVELKKKYAGIVYKRRIAMPLLEAEAYLERGGQARAAQGAAADGEADGSKPGQLLWGAHQIEREIDWALAYYRDLRPAMYLSYDRLAYCGKEDPGLRITFDSNVRFRQEELDLRAGAWGQMLLPPGMWLMEVKVHGSMPLWLVHMLDWHHIYPTSFSKYGKAYLMNGGYHCA